jgi:hypothetical protein
MAALSAEEEAFPARAAGARRPPLGPAEIMDLSWEFGDSMGLR